MDDHVRFSGKKFLTVGLPALEGHHYKGDAHKLRTAVKSFFVFFLRGWTPRPPRLMPAFRIPAIKLGRVLATACDW
jgi:hypothetical protein